MINIDSAGFTSFCRVNAIASLMALLSGCVILPVPVNFTKDSLSSEQIGSVKADESTKQGVRDELGSPHFERDDGRIWIYAWESKHGTWLVLPLVPDGPLGTIGDRIYYTTRVMVLEFDSNEVLREKAFAHYVKGSDDRYCTEAELCIEHKSPIEDSTNVTHFSYGDTAVTVSGKAKEKIARVVEPQATECLLVVWPDKDLAKADASASGLAVQLEGVTGSYAWLPEGAFAMMTLPPGAQTVQVTFGREVKAGESEPSSASFDCNAGAYTYLAVGVEKKDDGQLATVARTVGATAAQTLIASMPQVLLHLGA